MMNKMFTTKSMVQAEGYFIKNAVIESLDLILMGHFGDAVSLACKCQVEDGGVVCPFGTYTYTQNIGYVLQCLYQLLGVSDEDGKLLSSVKNVPCRLIFDGDGGWESKCVGIGNFLQDRFIYKDDLVETGVREI